MVLKQGSTSTSVVRAASPVGSSNGTGIEFQPLTQSDIFKPRLVISCAAPQKTGKTHFGLTMPPPIAYFEFENGLEGVANKPEFRHLVDNPSQFQKVRFDWTRPTKENKGSDRVKGEAQRASEKFQRHWYWAVDNFRTVIMDTATHIWEMFRIAEFGKLGEVMPQHYAPVNAEFRAFIDEALSSSVNLLMVHRVKEEWETKRIIRDGYKGAEFDAQVCIRFDRDYAEGQTTKDPPAGLFFFQVYECRQNPGLAGQTFVQPNNTFIDLARAVYPDVDEGVWL